MNRRLILLALGLLVASCVSYPSGEKPTNSLYCDNFMVYEMCVTDLNGDGEIEFVYFDLGKVLVHFEHQTAVEQLARLSGRPEVLVQQVVFDSDLQTRYETGLVSGEQFAAEVNTALESALPTADILQAISDIFSPL